MKPREQEARRIERALNDLVMRYIGTCPDCRQSWFACEKHRRLVMIVNQASDALSNVYDEVHKLEASK